MPSESAESASASSKQSSQPSQPRDDSRKTSLGRRVSESHVKPGSIVGKESDFGSGSLGDTRTAMSATSPMTRPSTEVRSRGAISTPSSPSLGTSSASTAPKEDELFSTPNGSSESNWEKHSQESQNGEKVIEKPESDKEQETTSPWDQETPPAAPLKDAPAPVFNIWEKRAQEAKEKLTRDVKSLPPTTSRNSNNKSGQTNGIGKPLDPSPNIAKMENKKKYKLSSQIGEERSVPPGIKDGGKTGDGKNRGSEGMIVRPRYLVVAHAFLPQKKTPFVDPDPQKQPRLLLSLLHHLLRRVMQSPGLLQILPKETKRKSFWIEDSKGKRARKTLR